ncbi:hypothetical protein CRU96_01370 [Malaciobacter halophilus]|nr:hypothetical protein [Malaciobacter halophilus]RYA24804.1 hypothetical protein CRU96_01370 [Malaciobacter halophilus]
MDLRELKKLREENFLAHKKKKREYYLKSKLEKKIERKSTKREVFDYESHLGGIDFNQRIKDIIRQQKQHVDDRKDRIVAKIKEYKSKKREYYIENKDKRLQYDKEYREEKKEELREYRRRYYQKNKDKILEKQRKRRKQQKDKE